MYVELEKYDRWESTALVSLMCENVVPAPSEYLPMVIREVMALDTEIQRITVMEHLIDGDFDEEVEYIRGRDWNVGWGIVKIVVAGVVEG